MRVLARPVHEFAAVQEAEAALVRRRAERVLAGFGNPEPAAVEADVEVGIAERIEGIADVRAGLLGR